MQLDPIDDEYNRADVAALLSTVDPKRLAELETRAGEGRP
jgi:hypothetical protein